MLLRESIASMPMSDDELRLLKKAGFNWFKLGIESITEDVLNRAHKGKYNRDVVRRVVRRIHDAGIDLCANYMFGLPGDTWETMQDNLNFAFELNCAFPSFFCAMAPPGSDLYNEVLAKGIPLPEKMGRLCATRLRVSALANGNAFRRRSAAVP